MVDRGSVVGPDEAEVKDIFTERGLVVNVYDVVEGKDEMRVVNEGLRLEILRAELSEPV